jgi:hypothetical protein
MLVVDDQNGDSDILNDYTEPLDALGVDYDVWDTTAAGGDPTAQNLAPYQTIIWLTGADSDATAGPNEDELATHIDNTPGACLFLSSQDYLWGQGGGGADTLTNFMMTYLGASQGQSDVTQTTVTGAADFSDLGPYALSYPFTNYSDRLEADETASVVFTGNAGNAAISKVTATYRTTWWGFPFEAIPSAAERQQAMAAVLQWCSVDPPVNYGVELDVEEAAMTGMVGEMVTWTLSITNTGDMTDTFTLEATSMWTTTLAEDSVILDAGASSMVWAWVYIPASASDGEMDMATVTATSNNDMGESDSVEFTTTAENNEGADGVDDETEDGAPNDGDGNGDGIADSEQDNVTSLPNQGGGDEGYVTLVAREGTTLVGVQASPAPMTLPDGIESMPQGLFDFTIEGLTNGEQVTVTLYLETYDTPVTGYWKYDEMADSWTDYTEYALLGTHDVNGTTVTTIMLSLTDGGMGDADGTENGIIVDPGGPTTASVPTSVSLAEFSGEATMTWPLYGLLALLLLVVTATTAIFRLRVPQMACGKRN